jgi:hypothetical protein
MGGTKKPSKPAKKAPKRQYKPEQRSQLTKLVKTTPEEKVALAVQKAHQALQDIGSPISEQDLLELHQTRQVQVKYTPLETDAPDTVAAKLRMLQALERSLGVVTSAAKVAGIHRDTHYSWMIQDDGYRLYVEGLSDVAIDFAETMLHRNIRNGDATSTIFFLKTKGKRRGYIETTHTHITEEAPLHITRTVVHQAVEVKPS